MIRPSPEAIAASLNETQREIVLYGPSSFAEADAIPEDLYDEDLTVQEDGDEVFFWTATELGRRVREVLEAKDQSQ
jgi:hypothetical protein